MASAAGIGGADAAAGAGAAASAASAGGGLLATVSPYLTAASAVASGVGALAQGSSQAAAQRYNQQIDQINAGQALTTSAADMQRDQIRAQRTVASSAADFGASGVALGSGSPLNVLADQAAQGALNAQIVQYRGQSQATAALNSAAQAGFQANQDEDAGAITAGTTLLTQGARYATSLYPRYGGAIGAAL